MKAAEPVPGTIVGESKGCCCVEDGWVAPPGCFWCATKSRISPSEGGAIFREAIGRVGLDPTPRDAWFGVRVGLIPGRGGLMDSAVLLTVPVPAHGREVTERAQR
jgi:hypothetical protein